MGETFSTSGHETSSPTRLEGISCDLVSWSLFGYCGKGCFLCTNSPGHETCVTNEQYCDPTSDVEPKLLGGVQTDASATKGTARIWQGVSSVSGQETSSPTRVEGIACDPVSWSLFGYCGEGCFLCTNSPGHETCVTSEAYCDPTFDDEPKLLKGDQSGTLATNGTARIWQEATSVSGHETSSPTHVEGIPCDPVSWSSFGYCGKGCFLCTNNPGHETCVTSEEYCDP